MARREGLCFYEELMLLALRDEEGTFATDDMGFGFVVEHFVDFQKPVVRVLPEPIGNCYMPSCDVHFHGMTSWADIEMSL